MTKQAIQTLPVPFCPDCGAQMVLRKPRPGQEWQPFWGCALYPECHGSRNIGPDGKPEAEDYDRLDNLWTPDKYPNGGRY